MDDNDWMARGNCRFEPPATFFPSDGVGVEIAKRICTTCATRPLIEKTTWSRANSPA